MRTRILAGTALLLQASVVMAAAQSFPFERTFEGRDVHGVDVRTIRGKVEVVGSSSDRVVVSGEVTVRVGFDVPADAVAIARRVSAEPPVTLDEDTVTLRPPVDDLARRAVTVSYRVRVPRTVNVRIASDSGAVRVESIGGTVAVRTQSSTIDLLDLRNGSTIESGSGAVTVDRLAGSMNVTTSSSGLKASGVAGNVHVRTQSGNVDIAFSGAGDAEVTTGSSAVRLASVRGEITVVTQSGRVIADGAPSRWNVQTSSSQIDLTTRSSSLTIDLQSQSGSVTVQGATVNGTVDRRRATGTIGDGAGSVTATSASGAITLRVVR